MEGLGSAGATGLAHNVNKRESAHRDLATYEKLVNMKKQSETEEQQAALIEQQYYERLRKEADQMLAGDRKAINAKSKSIQSQIRSQIRAFGGSRAKFMANGGVALIGDYTNNVLNSDEVQTYKQNKINLEKILDLKEKKMGHLLTEKDKLSLLEYEKNGYGEITYSGVMNEIDIPDDDKFERGTYAMPIDILRNGNNFVKILANYQLENPEYDPATESDEKIWRRMLGYATVKGWSTKGTHETKFQNNNAGGGGSRGTSSTSTSKADNDRTIAGGMFMHYNSKQPNIPLSKMGASTGDPDQAAREDFIKGIFGDNAYTKTSKTDKTWGVAIQNVASVGLKDNENVYRPRNANDLGNTMNLPLWQTQNGADYLIENGVIKDVNIMGLKNLFDANGEAIVDKGDMETGNLRIVGSFDGWGMKGVDGRETLVMDALTEDGKYDEKRTKSLYQTEEGAKEPAGQRGMFIALQDEDNNIFYQKVNMDGIQQKNVLAKYLGEELNTITEEVGEAGRMKAEQQEKLLAVEVKRGGKARLDIHNPTFLEDVNFQEQVKAYNYYMGGNLRSNLMKSFYMAEYDYHTTPDEKGVAGSYDISKQVEQNRFGGIMSMLGLDRDIMNYQMDDRTMLSLISQKMLLPENSETVDIRKNNLILLEKMKQYLIKSYQLK